MRSPSTVEIAWLLVVGVMLGAATAAEPARPPKRARPPVWSRDVLDAFFDDAREKLDGPRPDYNARTAPGEHASASGNPDATSPSTVAWSKLIAPQILESEIKRLTQSTTKSVTTPTAFKADGYKTARRDFSTLAVLFAVTAQYDGDARWKDAAPGLRDLFARAGDNCRVGTDQTFNEATQCKQDLADLVRGSRPQVPKADASVDDWSKVADRPPLMQRMNIAHEERLKKWFTDAVTFRRNKSDIRHEAQLVATIAEIIGRKDFEFWDDAEYATFARELRQAATDIAAAAEDDNFDKAQAAIGRTIKACADCHEGYRG